MPSRDEAIAKVVKVLRLARGAGTEHEAHAALLTAQKLMYQHDIGEHEVHDQAAPSEAILDTVVEQSGERMPWNEYLAAVIAENFRCAYIISRSRSTGVTRLVFVGRSADVTVAAEAYQSAATAARQLGEAFAASREPGARAAAKDSYLIGFLKGLYERFQVNITQGALVVQTEAEVVAHAAAFTNAEPAQGAALTASDAEAVDRGFATGYQYGSGTKPIEK